MFKPFLYFAIACFVMTLLGVTILAIFLDFKLALILSLLLGFIFGLFSLGFTQRTLSSQTIEINASNKNPDHNMRWYEDRIREQIKDMRFLAAGKTPKGVELFKPRGLYKVFEPEVLLEVTPYDITVTASRLMIRLIGEYVEIAPKVVDQQKSDQ